MWNYADDVREEVSEKLVPLQGKDFVCLHPYGAYVFFKPTVAQVLAQIDKNLIHQVKAFEITAAPKIAFDIAFSSFKSIALENGFHVSNVRLYVEKKWDTAKIGVV